jgi:hypothetical protein
MAWANKVWAKLKRSFSMVINDLFEEDEREMTPLDAVRVAFARHRLNGTVASIEKLMDETGLSYAVVRSCLEQIRGGKR